MLDSTKSSVIDATVLSHQIPGGMFSNLLSQLREAGAEDRLQEVIKEIPITRRELGYPPLVTPMSQMIGSQAVSNIMFGRYKMVSTAITDYVLGKYGRPPMPIEESVKEIVLKDKKGEVNTVKSRPADELKPEMEKAKEELTDITGNIDDILTYALYPVTGLKFLRRKYGLASLSEDLTDNSPVSKNPTSGQTLDEKATTKTGNLKEFNVYLDNEVFYVEVDPTNMKHAQMETSSKQPSNSSEASVKDNEIIIRAPINGIVIKHLVSEGEQVSAGQDIVVLEAMKMENTLPSPSSGTIKNFTQDIGVKVDKGSVLVVIEPNH